MGFLIFGDSGFDHLGHGFDKDRVIVDGFGPDHVQANSGTGGFGFEIEVVHDFDVIGNKSDRAEDNVLDPLLLNREQIVVYVRFEPRSFRITTAALPGECPVGSTDLFDHGLTGVFNLTCIGAAGGHGCRNGVGGEDDSGFGATFGGNFIESGTHLGSLTSSEYPRSSTS